MPTVCTLVVVGGSLTLQTGWKHYRTRDDATDDDEYQIPGLFTRQRLQPIEMLLPWLSGLDNRETSIATKDHLKSHEREYIHVVV